MPSTAVAVKTARRPCSHRTGCGSNGSNFALKMNSLIGLLTDYGEAMGKSRAALDAEAIAIRGLHNSLVPHRALNAGCAPNSRFELMLAFGPYAVQIELCIDSHLFAAD